MSHGTIFIVDENAEDRESLADLLRCSGDYDVVPIASTDQLLNAIRAPLPGCMVVNLDTFNEIGLSIQAVLETRGICVPAIVLSEDSSCEAVVAAVRQGARHVFEKGCDPLKLLSAIESCCNDAEWRNDLDAAFDPDDIITEWDFIRDFYGLSRRQCEVAQRICRSMSNDEIAYSLFVSSNTVRMHIKALYEKLNVNNRVGVVMRCLYADVRARGREQGTGGAN